MVVMYATRVTVAEGAYIFCIQTLAVSPEVANLTCVALSSCRSMLTVDTHPTPSLDGVVRVWVNGGIVDALGCMTVALTQLAVVRVHLVPTPEWFVIGQSAALFTLSPRKLHK